MTPSSCCILMYSNKINSFQNVWNMLNSDPMNGLDKVMGGSPIYNHGVLDSVIFITKKLKIVVVLVLFCFLKFSYRTER